MTAGSTAVVVDSLVAASVVDTVLAAAPRAAVVVDMVPAQRAAVVDPGFLVVGT